MEKKKIKIGLVPKLIIAIIVACKQNSHTENTCKDPAHGSFFHNVHHKIPFK